MNYIHDKKLFGAKYLMMLCDMWPVETFLSEYLRFENITLIHGQHAIFQPLNENDYINNISGVFRNNRNCNDKYLTWGGGYDLPSLCTHYKLGADLDLIPCGNPVIYDFTGEQSDKWLIILDVPAFRETNQKIIYIVTEVARTLNKKILIRLHPHERGIKAPYKIDDSICEYSTENIYPAVVFGHTSTILYTYLARNVLTLKIKSEDIFLF